MNTVFKVGDIVKFIPSKFLYTISRTYPNATETELYKVIRERYEKNMVDVSPLKNPHIKLTGIYDFRFQKVAQKNN